MKERATRLGWRNPDRPRGGGPDKGPSGPAGTSRRLAPLPDEHDYNEGGEHDVYSCRRCVTIREHALGGTFHDFRRVRCSPEGHFVAVTDARSLAAFNLACDCGQLTLLSAALRTEPHPVVAELNAPDDETPEQHHPGGGICRHGRPFGTCDGTGNVP